MTKYICDYEAIYVDHAPGEDFTLARARRVRRFKTVTGLEVVPRSERRTRSYAKMYDYFRWSANGRVNLDHTTFWRLGNIPFLMTEPYDGGKSQLIHRDYVGIIIPEELSPYCGFWRPPSTDPGSCSYLFAPFRYSGVLADIKIKLDDDAKLAPPWYALLDSDDER
jgi:hypothetical protein